MCLDGGEGGYLIAGFLGGSLEMGFFAHLEGSGMVEMGRGIWWMTVSSREKWGCC